MATEYTVCIIAEQETLKELKDILDIYDVESKEIADMIEDNQDMEYRMPVCVYNDCIEIEGSALWLEARRYCGGEFIAWLAKKVRKQLVYGIHSDCGGGDNYLVGIARADGTDEIKGSIDAFKHLYPDGERRELYIEEFLEICKAD